MLYCFRLTPPVVHISEENEEDSEATTSSHLPGILWTILNKVLTLPLPRLLSVSNGDGLGFPNKKHAKQNKTKLKRCKKTQSWQD
jgi:hypothetical protein